MAGEGAAIGAGEIKDAAKANRLKRPGHQGHRRAKGIEIDKIKPLLNSSALGQQFLDRDGAAARPAHGAEIALQQRQAIGIGVIGPDLGGMGFEPVAQGANAAARQTIEHR